eukprot:6213991-Pleurochrysis_carterae.AAC.1
MIECIISGHGMLSAGNRGEQQMIHIRLAYENYWARRRLALHGRVTCAERTLISLVNAGHPERIHAEHGAELRSGGVFFSRAAPIVAAALRAVCPPPNVCSFASLRLLLRHFPVLGVLAHLGLLVFKRAQHGAGDAAADDGERHGEHDAGQLRCRVAGVGRGDEARHQR